MCLLDNDSLFSWLWTQMDHRSGKPKATSKQNTKRTQRQFNGCFLCLFRWCSWMVRARLKKRIFLDKNCFQVNLAHVVRAKSASRKKEGKTPTDLTLQTFSPPKRPRLNAAWKQDQRICQQACAQICFGVLRELNLNAPRLLLYWPQV